MQCRRRRPRRVAPRPHTEVHTYFVAEQADVSGVWVHNNSADDVIEETTKGTGDFTSSHSLTADDFLSLGDRWLGPGYREVSRNSGVFRSADGLRQMRMDPKSLGGLHNPKVPHVHLERFANAGDAHAVANNHIPLR